MIHKFAQNNTHIVLDVNSGAVHLVDKLIYDLLDYVTEPPTDAICPESILKALSDQYKPEALQEAYAELHTLYSMGHLFSPDDYGQFSSLMAVSPIKALCLHVAHDCNMRCEYCFAGKGDYSGQRMIMPPHVAKSAIDYLVAHSGNRHNLEVDFFGGEPLMNFEVVKETIAYARSLEQVHDKSFRFTITTNGLLLTDDKIDFINREMYNVVLSIDGRADTNDRVRRLASGQGSCHDRILPGFKKLVAARGEGQYYVRGTFTRYNLDFMEDVLHLYRQGFDQISVEPVVADPAMPYALTEADIPTISAEYERLAEELLRREREGEWFNFFHFMMDLEQGPCAIKRLRGCGCGNEYVAVTPDGEVYPCHQFVGHPQWRMGDVATGEIDLKIKADFAAATVYGKPQCRDCWAKFYCSGGCNANSYIYNGDIAQPHKMSCELEKKRLECALYIKAAGAMEEEVTL
jgi:uncharacterized protein